MVVTNDIYKNFTPLGVRDPEQFWLESAFPTTPDKRRRTFRTGPKSVFESSSMDVSTLFDSDDTAVNVENTFKYIFHKFKKGIFVRIRNNKLDCFTPFSKALYVNEWSDRIKIDPKYGGRNDFERMYNFFKAHHNLSNALTGKNYRFDANKVSLDPSYWFANNTLMRYENPINESNTNCAQLRSMLVELCASRNVPDAEFFINRRDFPILTRDGTEPYDHIYGDYEPLVSYKFEKYAPVLSMCTSARYADVGIPTHEDWARVKSAEDGEPFPPKNTDYGHPVNRDWKSKKEVAVFRGSNTGYGCLPTDNARLKLVEMGRASPTARRLLDVGITNWNLRVRKIKGEPYLQFPNVSGFTLSGRLSYEQQSDFKYIINVDGHTAAFRLSHLLGLSSCVLLVDGDWKLWFSHLLRPYEHFVPIKADLSDLIDQVKWCIRNDSKCELISRQALEFHKKYLSKNGVLDYTAGVLDRLFSGRTTARPRDPLLLQSARERIVLWSPSTEPTVRRGSMGEFPQLDHRNYGVMRGLEKFVKLGFQLGARASVKVEGVLFQSRTTRVETYAIGSKRVVSKNSSDVLKKMELVHSAFVGKFAINDMLKVCPNFVYTLACREESKAASDVGLENPDDETTTEISVIEERLEGPTLQKFLKTCSVKNYLEILLGLQCALAIARYRCGFVHRDLAPWNVVVEILHNPIDIEYHVQTDQNTGERIAYKIRTRHIPIMVDYGKSHVVVDGVHHGIVEPYEFDQNIDLMVMVTTTLNEMIQRTDLSESDFQDLIYLANFLSSKKISNAFDLSRFVSKAKKIATLGAQSEMKTLFDQVFDPLLSDSQFSRYLVPLIRKHKISYGKVELSLSVWTSNPRQIVDMAFGLDLDAKVQSYLETARRIYKNPMPQASNRFAVFMIAQKLYDGLNYPKLEFLEFATETRMDDHVVRKVLADFKKMETFMVDFYSTKLKEKKNTNFSNLLGGRQSTAISSFRMKPSRNLFLKWSKKDQEQLKRETAGLPDPLPSYLYYRPLIVDVFRNQGPFKMADDDVSFYALNFKHILDEEFTSKVWAIETIRNYSKKIASESN